MIVLSRSAFEDRNWPPFSSAHARLSWFTLTWDEILKLRRPQSLVNIYCPTWGRRLDAKKRNLHRWEARIFEHQHTQKYTHSIKSNLLILHHSKISDFQFFFLETMLQKKINFETQATESGSLQHHSIETKNQQRHQLSNLRSALQFFKEYKLHRWEARIFERQQQPEIYSAGHI